MKVTRWLGALGAATALVLATQPAGSGAVPAEQAELPAAALDGGWSSEPPPRMGAASLRLTREEPVEKVDGYDRDGKPGYSVRDLRQAYELPADGSGGEGVLVANIVYGDYPQIDADLAGYRAHNGLPACTRASGCFREVAVDGAVIPRPGALDPGPDSLHWDFETAIDLQAVSASCPRCRLMMVRLDDWNYTSFLMAVRTAVRAGAKVVNTPQYYRETPENVRRWERVVGAPRGVSFVTSGGDWGYRNNGLGADNPTFVPQALPQWITVTATRLLKEPSVPRKWRETSWIDHSNPPYVGNSAFCARHSDAANGQEDTVPDTGCQGTRAAGDVSVNGFFQTALFRGQWLQSNWSSSGGSPFLAGMLAASGYAGAYEGADALYYKGPEAINDVTEGYEEGCPPRTRVCATGDGWDGPTGVGTPRGFRAFAPSSRWGTSSVR